MAKRSVAKQVNLVQGQKRTNTIQPVTMIQPVIRTNSRVSNVSDTRSPKAKAKAKKGCKSCGK